MLVSTAMTRINYVLRGTDDNAPGNGTDDYIYWLDTLNRKKNEMYRDVTKQWRSAYQVLNVGTIAANTAPSFALSATFLAPSDDAYVIDTGGLRHDYTLIEPEDRRTDRQQVFIAGANPETLYFANPILSTDTIVNGTLYLPGYYLPADMTGDSSTLPVDDPDWLCMAVAAEIAFGDLTYEDKAADLQAKANNLYDLMVKSNRRGTASQPRKVATGLPTALRRSRY